MTFGRITAARIGALEPLLDARDAANYLNLSVSWVYKAAEKGELPCLRIGSALRFEPEALRAWVKSKTRAQSG
jgi:excisionase family DNA binding protein